MQKKPKKIIEILNNRQLLFVAHKLSYDILFLTTISLICAIFLEAMLPGIVSQKNGFLAIFFVLFLSIFTVSKTGEKLEINSDAKQNNRLMPIILVISFILIGNSLLKFSLWGNLVITTLTIFIFFIIYHIIFPEKK